MPDITFDGPGGSTRNQVYKGAHHEEQFTHGRSRFKATATGTTADPRGYAAGDVIGEALTFAFNVPLPGKGEITGVRVVDKSGQAPAVDVVVYQSQILGTGDRGQADPTDSDIGYIVGGVSVLAADYRTFANNSAASVSCGLTFNANTSGYLMAEIVARQALALIDGGDIIVTLLGVID